MRLKAKQPNTLDNSVDEKEKVIPFAYLACAIIIGALLSYLSVNNTFTVNADVSNSPVVWNEIQLFGLSVLGDWAATPDNWYFSNYPIHFLIFSLLGASSPTVIMLISVVQLLLMATVSALIILSITKSNLSYLAIPLFCSFGWESHVMGYIAHPFSHNLINGYGLLCVLLYLYNKQKSTLKLDFTIFIITVLASVSDPWFVAAFYIPILCGYLSDVYFFKSKSKRSLIFPLLSGVIIFSHVIEKLLNLPIGHFELGSLDQIPEKIYWVLYGLGENASIAPAENQSLLVASGVIWFILYAYNVLKTKEINTYTIITVLSIMGILGAFLLGSVPASPSSARFFTNITYIIILSSVASFIKSRSGINAVVLIFFICTSLFSHINSKSRIPEIQDFVATHGEELSTNEIVSFLKENDLHYGFGPYWGMQANAIGWATNNDFIVRPAYFDAKSGEMKYPGRAQSFSHWYNPENQPDAVPQFIAVMSDKEECPDLNLCISGVQEQFGKADKDIVFHGAHVLVYNHKILGFNRLSVSGNGAINLGIKEDKNIWKGFRSKEEGFRWTSGKDVEIYLSSSQWKSANIEIQGGTYQDLSGVISVNGGKERSFSLAAGEVSLTINSENRTDSDDLNVKIHFNQVKSPKEAGINSDTAKLGIAVKRIKYDIYK